MVDEAKEAGSEESAPLELRNTRKKLQDARAALEQENFKRAKRLAEQALARAESLEEQIQKLKARKTERGLVLTLSDVLFDYNKTELKPGAYRTVDRLANFLKEHDKRHVFIEGFTDSKGSEAYNQRLSERRANAVREALLQRGVGAHRVRVRGYGESFPVASNATSTGRAQNRRVEIIISDVDGKIPRRGS